MRHLVRPAAGAVRPLPRPLSRSEAAGEGAPATGTLGSSRDLVRTEVHRRRCLTRRRGTHGHETRRPPLLQLRCGRGDGGEGTRERADAPRRCPHGIAHPWGGAEGDTRRHRAAGVVTAFGPVPGSLLPNSAIEVPRAPREGSVKTRTWSGHRRGGASHRRVDSAVREVFHTRRCWRCASGEASTIVSSPAAVKVQSSGVSPEFVADHTGASSPSAVMR
jgi:hypothetical protein